MCAPQTRSRPRTAVDLVLSAAGSVERRPDKAGVGGSFPSLATMFSNTCKHLSSAGLSHLSQSHRQFTRLPSFSTALTCDSGRSCS
jgi:hypothetical protein